MNAFLGTVGLVTLALGAIGVVNIMLVAVSERTREIGLTQSAWRDNRSIMLQFFAEGVLLTLVSGLIGMGLAGALMAAIPDPQARADSIRHAWLPRPPLLQSSVSRLPASWPGYILPAKPRN